MEGALKLLRVALLGTPNVGKSTLLNRLVCNEISCVSNKVHTTRKNILGVYTEGDTQLEFFDSPGIIDKQHSAKHNIESTLVRGPEEAALRCDLLAVMVDISNPREQRRLNKGLLSMLYENTGKQSILIMNKIDLIKEKRKLLDLSFTLTQGCIDGKPTRQRYGDPLDIAKKTPSSENSKGQSGTLHKYVIDLNKENRQYVDELPEDISKPTQLGYKNFSQVFSISALNDDGVEELRNHMLSLAKPVNRWPHGPDYLTNQNSQDVAHSIIRGRLMDHVDKAIPYLLIYKYRQFEYDDVGSLHIQLTVKCPESYMVPKVIGEKGVTISRVSADSRDAIANALGADVKLMIQVECLKNIDKSDRRVERGSR